MCCGAKTTDDLKEISGRAADRRDSLAVAETATRGSPAWFLGLRPPCRVYVAALEQEFGREMVEPAMEIVGRLVPDGLLTFDGEQVRLTARGRMISNDVFQEFLQPGGCGDERRRA